MIRMPSICLVTAFRSIMNFRWALDIRFGYVSRFTGAHTHVHMEIKSSIRSIATTTNSNKVSANMCDVREYVNTCAHPQETSLRFDTNQSKLIRTHFISVHTAFFRQLTFSQIKYYSWHRRQFSRPENLCSSSHS